MADTKIDAPLALINVSVRKVGLSLADQEKLLREFLDLQDAHTELLSKHEELERKFARVTSCR